MKLLNIHPYQVLRDAVKGFRRHQAPRLGAALAFYTMLSLSPLLLIVLAILGFVFGSDAAHGAISSQIEDLVGTQGAKAIEALVADANQSSRGIVATVIGVVVLFFGASGVFVELKGAIDVIWETPPDESPGLGLRSLFLERMMAFMMICALAFLLLVSLVFSTVLTMIGNKVFGLSQLESTWANIANIVVSFLLTTGIVAIIFKLMPTRKSSWNTVLFGSIVTALLFFVGKSMIGIYLGRAAVGSAYGAAGSLVVLLVWVYYSTQIILFGVEITRVMTLQGTQPNPSPTYSTNRKLNIVPKS